MTNQLIAIDLGATSGRVIRGVVGPHILEHEVVHRFANGPTERDGELFWDSTGLFARILEGMSMVSGEVASVGVDSWAVDYGLLRDGELLWQPHHYRDERNRRGVENVHAQMGHEALYRRNGLQFLPFNTVYQLATEEWSNGASTADSLLLIPDLINYWLTGERATEITNASTTGLCDVRSGEFDDELIALSGAPRELFAPIAHAGDRIGDMTESIQSTVGFSAPVVAVGSHDTASAIVATPLEGDESAYISCGTWGLVGVETAQPIVTEAARGANFTNERGVDGRIRFLHNVMGLWLLNESVAYWAQQGVNRPVAEWVKLAADYSGERAVFDVNDSMFMAPGDIPVRIAQWCEEHGVAAPESEVAMVASIVESLATAFSKAAHTAAELSGTKVSTINVVGGGSQIELLLQRLADVSGCRVVAGPVEATALGNLLVQARSAGMVRGDLDTLRALVRRAFSPRVFTPQVGAVI
jgi:rhamnulokinase